MNCKRTTSASIRASFRSASRLALATVLALTIAVGAFAGSVMLPGSQAEAQSVAYRLSPGDKVRVTVFGHEDLSGEFEVDPEGRISLPLIQYVDAQGTTSQELEANITSSLSPDYLKDPRVSVEILNYRPFYILGEVESPGSYDYVNGMTVLESVAVAGGFTYRAKQKKMTIVRASDPEKKKMPASVDTRVLPGDVIEVPERRW